MEAGYHSYPTDRPASVPDKPGNGSQKITGMASIYVPAPAGPDKNSWCAGLNDRLGVDVSMTMVASTDDNRQVRDHHRRQRPADMLQMQVVANFPQLLDQWFTVLDDYLFGDAIKDYPNLANIPTFTWNNAVYNGHLYGTDPDPARPSGRLRLHLTRHLRQEQGEDRHHRRVGRVPGVDEGADEVARIHAAGRSPGRTLR